MDGTAPWWLAAAIATACVAAAVTYLQFETDLWQHLVVGRLIWTRHVIPTLQWWSWPTFGAPDTTSSWSWLFRALLWPVWSAGGEVGLQAWRWVTTLAAFGLLWATARVLGARGFAPLWVGVLGAMVYRQRAQVRPETLVAVLLALALWLLERRRHGGPVHAGWLVALLWVWVNVHVSWIVGLFVVAVFAWDEARRRSPAAGPPLWQALVAAPVAALANPYGWRALWQPFHLAAMAREPLLRSIGELRPLQWGYNVRNGLPLLLALAAAGLVWRARRGTGDAVAATLLAAFTAMALVTSRFVGFLAVVAVPYVARDLSAMLGALRLGPRGAWPRAAVTVGAMLALLPWELARHDLRPGIGIAPDSVPRAACDFVAAHEVRGRCFNSFELGGYLLWRFWPDPDRLPFMDIHQSGTPARRLEYLAAQVDPAAWRALAARDSLAWCLLRRRHAAGDHLLDILDADPAWALVFVDDVAAVYVRRADTLARFAYRLVPAGTARLASLDTLADAPAGRAALRAELTRAIGSSPQSSSAWSLLSALEARAGRIPEARAALEHAHAIDPDVPLYRQRRRALDQRLAGESPAGGAR